MIDIGTGKPEEREEKLPAETPLGAFIQTDRKTYAVVPRTPMGLVTPEALDDKDKALELQSHPAQAILPPSIKRCPFSAT